MQQALAKDLEQKPLPAIDRPAVMFVISKTYAEGVSQERLYEATRGNWRIGAGSRAQAEVALGIADGIVRTAFEIDRWGGADESAAPWTAKAEDNRWYFEGHETGQTSSWLGLSVRHLAPPKGAANPVRLFLDGIPGPEQEAIADSSTVLQDEALGRIMYGRHPVALRQGPWHQGRAGRQTRNRRLKHSEATTILVESRNRPPASQPADVVR
ncbi:hypothetical protein ACHMXB_01220 [Arthrobacter sp. UC242_113]|uniref:hypothetical protein n=1 Tax=Arthrobacter sp. UC242_113 TaxID=3374550 RepID=UPI003756E255